MVVRHNKIELWLKERYQTSVFNTCEHSQLPMMEGPPLELHIDPSTKPVQCNVPILVLLHWWEQVKADLDRHSTWCD
jgi:predicted GH43/DUF377 family glycosyl hydrolase